MHAERPRLVRGRRHYAPILRPPTYHDRPACQRRVLDDFDGSKKGIEIQVYDCTLFSHVAIMPRNGQSGKIGRLDGWPTIQPPNLPVSHVDREGSTCYNPAVGGKGMDRLGQIWRNINRLDRQRKTVVILFLMVIVITWLAACLLLLSVLIG